VLATQTTLSIRDTEDIIKILKKRFPSIISSPRRDICLATENRQQIAITLAKKTDTILVLGSSNSSNTMRLVEIIQKEGARAILVNEIIDIPAEQIKKLKTIGLTAGASTPESFTKQVIDELTKIGFKKIKSIGKTKEEINLKVPNSFF